MKNSALGEKLWRSFGYSRLGPSQTAPRGLLFGLIGLLAAGALQAATATAPPGVSATLTWSPTTTDVNGNALIAGGYNVYNASTDAALTALPNTAGGITVNGPNMTSVGNVTSFTTPPLAVGSYFYAVTAWVCSAASVCTESAQSVHVSVTVSLPAPPTGAPAAPAGVKAQCSASSSAGVKISCTLG